MRGFNWTRPLPSSGPDQRRITPRTNRSENGKNIGCREMSVILSSTDEFSRESMSDATLLLNAVEQGDPTAAEKLLELLYGELRRLAAFKMAGQAPGQTLQPTALVHEAWLRLV